MVEKPSHITPTQSSKPKVRESDLFMKSSSELTCARMPKAVYLWSMHGTSIKLYRKSRPKPVVAMPGNEIIVVEFRDKRE